MKDSKIKVAFTKEFLEYWFKDSQDIGNLYYNFVKKLKSILVINT